MNKEITEYGYGDDIAIIKERNQKVELDKARETSLFRKLTIAIFTYLLMLLFFYLGDSGLTKSIFVKALIPTLGFLLSTLSLGFLKILWLRYYKHKQ